MVPRNNRDGGKGRREEKGMEGGTEGKYKRNGWRDDRIARRVRSRHKKERKRKHPGTKKYTWHLYKGKAQGE